MMILPTELRRLEYHGPASPSDKPHEQALCQRCQELGYNCKNAPTEAVVNTEDLGDDDDDVSVACTDTSEDENAATQNNEDITPVGSEDEAERNDEELNKQMGNLKII